MEDPQFFFNSWMSLIRTFTIGVLSYFSIVFLLRVSGKRTLSKMNSFDFIVTVALGSLLAAVMINPNISLLDGILAFSILIFLQYFITFLSYRSKTITDLIKSEPALLFYKGRYLRSVMKKERFTEEEILAAIRDKGMGNIQEVEAVVIETDGRLSIIKKIGGQGTAMSTVENIRLPE
jgi:uncharacterized membrane protein YcaP (DUF421 family)